MLVVICVVIGVFSVVQTVRLVGLWRLSERMTPDERRRALGSFRCGVRVGGLTSPATATYPFGRLTVLPDSLVVRFPLLGDFRFPREESRFQAMGKGFELRRGEGKSALRAKLGMFDSDDAVVAVLREGGWLG